MPTSSRILWLLFLLFATLDPAVARAETPEVPVLDLRVGQDAPTVTRYIRYARNLGDPEAIGLDARAPRIEAVDAAQARGPGQGAETAPANEILPGAWFASGTGSASRFELVASRLKPGWFGLRSDVHCFGVRKPRELASHGYTPPWAVAYTDSAADAPMLREADDAVLVNGTPQTCRALERALGRSVRRVEWR